MFAVYYCSLNKMGYNCFTESEIKIFVRILFYFCKSQYILYLKTKASDMSDIYIPFNKYSHNNFSFQISLQPLHSSWCSFYQGKTTEERHYIYNTVPITSNFLNGHNVKNVSDFLNSMYREHFLTMSLCFIMKSLCLQQHARLCSRIIWERQVVLLCQ